MAASDSAIAQVKTALGGQPPESITELDDASVTKLAQLLKSSRERQQAQLAESLEKALGHLPRLLRGPVKKVLFPKGGR